MRWKKEVVFPLDCSSVFSAEFVIIQRVNNTFGISSVSNLALFLDSSSKEGNQQKVLEKNTYYLQQ